MIAVPKSGADGFTRERTAHDDVREWAQSHPDGDGARPPLVWLGSPQTVRAARLADGGLALPGADGSRLEFSLARPFPAQMRDAGVPGDPPLPSLHAMYAWGAFAFLCAAGILFYRINRRRSGRARAPG